MLRYAYGQTDRATHNMERKMSSRRPHAGHKSNKAERQAAIGQRVIRITHEAIDGAKGFSKHSDVKWAQKEAHKWVGEHPELGSDYAVSADGVVKITVTGATLAEIFPGAVVKTVEFTDLHPLPTVDQVVTQAIDQFPEQAKEVVDDEEDDDEEPKSNSVVASKFKQRYRANAREHGFKGKAAKRSNWDWLAQEIAAQCLGSKHKLRVDDFVAVLDENGVDHSRWTNRSKGWEGRFRMTGRVALQRVVADRGHLVIGGVTKPAPAEFVAKYKTKD